MTAARSPSYWHVGLICMYALSLVGCSTYRSDLDRAMNHYNSENEYDQALALLEVLELDLDSFSMAEQAQYSYYRGMSHFRLGQRNHARHWLGLAAALELKEEGALSTDEKKRVVDTLDELNQERYGKKDLSSGGDSCTTDAECGKDRFCDAGKCKAAISSEGAAAGKECTAAGDCEGDQVCSDGKCTASAAQ